MKRAHFQNRGRLPFVKVDVRRLKRRFRAKEDVAGYQVRMVRGYLETAEFSQSAAAGTCTSRIRIQKARL